jgi:hypothetical protein
MKVADRRPGNRIRLSAGARQTNLTSQGLLKILRRTGSAIRDDGRWYVDQSVVDEISTARQVLGFARAKRSKGREKRALGGRRRVSELRRQGNPKALPSNKPDDSLRQPQVVPPESPA